MQVQRSFLNVVLPLEKEFYYDWWIAFVASCNGGVDFIDETLVYQRVHETNASIDKVISEKQRFINHREEIKTHLKKFLTAPNINRSDKKLGELFYKRLANLNSFYNRLRLFLLIFQYREIVFYRKRRLVSLFSNLKHSWRWAFR